MTRTLALTCQLAIMYVGYDAYIGYHVYWLSLTLAVTRTLAITYIGYHIHWL